MVRRLGSPSAFHVSTLHCTCNNGRPPTLLLAQLLLTLLLIDLFRGRSYNTATVVTTTLQAEAAGIPDRVRYVIITNNVTGATIGLTSVKVISTKKEVEVPGFKIGYDPSQMSIRPPSASTLTPFQILSSSAANCVIVNSAAGQTVPWLEFDLLGSFQLKNITLQSCGEFNSGGASFTGLYVLLLDDQRKVIAKSTAALWGTGKPLRTETFELHVYSTTPASSFTSLSTLAYSWFWDNRTTLSSMLDRCRTPEGLVSIPTTQAQSDVKSVFKMISSVAVGGFPIPAGSEKWVWGYNNTNFVDTNWASGGLVPNGGGANGSFVRVDGTDGKWYGNVDTALGFLCNSAALTSTALQTVPFESYAVTLIQQGGMTSSANLLATPTMQAPKFNKPLDSIVLRNGSILVLDTVSNKWSQYRLVLVANEKLKTVQGATLDAPYRMVLGLDADERVYLTDRCALRAFYPQSQSLTLECGRPSTCGRPQTDCQSGRMFNNLDAAHMFVWDRALGLLSNGSLIMTDPQNSCLIVFYPANKTRTVLAGRCDGKRGSRDGPASNSKFRTPTSFAVLPEGQAIFINDEGIMRKLYLKDMMVSTLSSPTLTVNTLLLGFADPTFSGHETLLLRKGTKLLLHYYRLNSSNMSILGSTTPYSLFTGTLLQGFGWTGKGLGLASNTINSFAQVPGTYGSEWTYGYVDPATGSQPVLMGIRQTTYRCEVIAGSGSARVTNATGEPLQAGIKSPTSIALLHHYDFGKFLLLDAGNYVIRLVDTNARQVSTYAGTFNEGFLDESRLKAQFSQLSCITRRPSRFGPAALFVLSDRNTVRQLSEVNGVVTIAGQSNVTAYAEGVGPAASFNSPQGLAWTAQGNRELVLIADKNNHVIRLVHLWSRKTELFAGTPQTSGTQDGDRLGSGTTFTTPLGMAVATQVNNTYVASLGSSIRKITGSTGLVSTLSVTYMKVPQIQLTLGLVASSDGNTLWAMGTTSLFVIDVRNAPVVRLRKVVGRTARTQVGWGSKAGFVSAKFLLLVRETYGREIFYVVDTAQNMIKNVSQNFRAVPVPPSIPHPARINVTIWYENHNKTWYKNWPYQVKVTLSAPVTDGILTVDFNCTQLNNASAPCSIPKRPTQSVTFTSALSSTRTLEGFTSFYPPEPASYVASLSGTASNEFTIVSGATIQKSVAVASLQLVPQVPSLLVNQSASLTLTIPATPTTGLATARRAIRFLVTPATNSSASLSISPSAVNITASPLEFTLVMKGLVGDDDNPVTITTTGARGTFAKASCMVSVLTAFKTGTKTGTPPSTTITPTTVPTPTTSATRTATDDSGSLSKSQSHSSFATDHSNSLTKSQSHSTSLSSSHTNEHPAPTNSDSSTASLTRSRHTESSTRSCSQTPSSSTTFVDRHVSLLLSARNGTMLQEGLIFRGAVHLRRAPLLNGNAEVVFGLVVSPTGSAVVTPSNLTFSGSLQEAFTVQLLAPTTPSTRFSSVSLALEPLNTQASVDYDAVTGVYYFHVAPQSSITAGLKLQNESVEVIPPPTILVNESLSLVLDIEPRRAMVRVVGNPSSLNLAVTYSRAVLELEETLVVIGVPNHQEDSNTTVTHYPNGTSVLLLIVYNARLLHPAGPNVSLHVSIPLKVKAPPSDTTDTTSSISIAVAGGSAASLYRINQPQLPFSVQAPQPCITATGTVPAQATLEHLIREEGFSSAFSDPPALLLLTPRRDWAAPYRSSLPVKVSARDFEVVFLVAENPSGFQKHSTNLSAVVSLELLNATSFEFSITALLEGYRTDEDEVIEVWLRPSFFLPTIRCLPVKGVPIFRLTVVATPDPAVASTQKAATVVTATAVTSSLAAGGSAAAGDAQSLALIAWMSCAKPAERQMTKNNRMLAPLPLGESLESMVIANALLVFLFILVQLTTLLVLKNVKKWRWLEASSLVRFPALTAVVCVLTHQGTGAAAMQLAFTQSHVDSIILGVVAAVYCVLLPLILYVVVRRHINASYKEYDYHRLMEDPAAITNRQRWVYRFRWFLPKGQWGPTEMRRPYGSLFSGVGRPEKLWCSQVTWAGTLMIIGTSFKPSSQSGCVQQFGWLGGIQMLMAAITLVFRPLRSHVANVLSALSSFCLGVVFSASATIAGDPDSPKAQFFLASAVQSQLALTALRMIYTGIVIGMERYVLHEVPSHEAWRWTGTRTSRKSLRLDNDEKDNVNDDREDVFFEEPLVTTGDGGDDRDPRMQQPPALLDLPSPTQSVGGDSSSGSDPENDANDGIRTFRSSHLLNRLTDEEFQSMVRQATAVVAENQENNQADDTLQEEKAADNLILAAGDSNETKPSFLLQNHRRRSFLGDEGKQLEHQLNSQPTLFGNGSPTTAPAAGAREGKGNGRASGLDSLPVSPKSAKKTTSNPWICPLPDFQTTPQQRATDTARKLPPHDGGVADDEDLHLLDDMPFLLPPPLLTERKGSAPTVARRKQTKQRQATTLDGLDNEGDVELLLLPSQPPVKLPTQEAQGEGGMDTTSEIDDLPLPPLPPSAPPPVATMSKPTARSTYMMPDDEMMNAI